MEFEPDAEIGQKRVFCKGLYYENCQLGLGRRFSLVVESAVQDIEKTPFRYSVLLKPFRRYLLQKFPYAIIYSIEPDHIYIAAVAHTKRKPGYWLIRVKNTEKNSLTHP